MADKKQNTHKHINITNIQRPQNIVLKIPDHLPRTRAFHGREGNRHADAFPWIPEAGSQQPLHLSLYLRVYTAHQYQANPRGGMQRLQMKVLFVLTIAKCPLFQTVCMFDYFSVLQTSHSHYILLQLICYTPENAVHLLSHYYLCNILLLNTLQLALIISQRLSCFSTFFFCSGMDSNIFIMFVKGL